MTGDCVYTTDVILDKDGYPRVKHQQRMWRLNRLIFTFVHGEIPEGMVVGHSCNNKGCINPNHLYLTTPKQNSTDAARDGLYRTGRIKEELKKADEDWLLICRMYHDEGMSQQAIADVYGTYQSRISEIIRENASNFLEMNDEL